MSTLYDYQVSFHDGEGGTITHMSVTAENLIAATYRAAEIAKEIDAADFGIKLLRSQQR